MKTKVLSTLSLAIMLALQGAHAQESDAADRGEEAGEDAYTIDTIQVTARRREEQLIDVPGSVSAFSGEALADVGAQDITYLKQTVPNTTLEVSRGTSSTLTAFIRGIGQQDPVAGFEAGVGIYLDDVYLNRPQGAVLEVYDVERVEVLRGPQGTLYGRNTIGGAVKYVTRRLGREPAVSVTGRLGSFSQQDLILRSETPIGDNFAVGASFASFSRGGYGTNLYLDEDNYNKDILAFRASAEWTPAYNTFVRLAADYMEDESNPVGGHRLIPGLFSGAPVLDHVFDSRSGLTGPNELESRGVSLLVEHDFNPQWQFKSITAYRDDEQWQMIDFEALPLADLDVPVRYENDQFSQEFQLAYSGDRVNGLFGFYYLDANAFNAFDVRLFATGDLIELPGLNAFTLGDVNTETWSVFADFSFDIGDYLGMETDLELTLGGRFTDDQRSSRVLKQTMLGESETFGGDPVILATTSDFDGSESWTDFSPRASLSWRPNMDHNLYVSYAQGFKGGSFDPRGDTTAAPDLTGDGQVTEEDIFQFMMFEPEEVDTWEIGAKSQFAGGRVNTAVALFRSDYTNIQVPGSIGVDTTGDGVFDTFTGVTTNAGAATVNGAEFEMTALLGRSLMTSGDSLSTSLAIGYIDASYDEWITAVTDAETGDVRLEDVSDDRVVQNTPDLTGHLNLRYERPMSLFGNAGDFGVVGAWSYRSKTYQFEIPNPFLDQPAYSLYDLSLFWRSLNGRYELGLHGRNLTNEEYQVAGYVFATPDGQQSLLGLEGVLNAFYGPPRSFTASVTVNF